jgi:hypothetical protein
MGTKFQITHDVFHFAYFKLKTHFNRFYHVAENTNSTRKSTDDKYVFDTLSVCEVIISTFYQKDDAAGWRLSG